MEVEVALWAQGESAHGGLGVCAVGDGFQQHGAREALEDGGELMRETGDCDSVGACWGDGEGGE